MPSLTRGLPNPREFHVEPRSFSLGTPPPMTIASSPDAAPELCHYATDVAQLSFPRVPKILVCARPSAICQRDAGLSFHS
jgi:hypothetical protein